MRTAVRAQIKFLDLLKEHGLLEKALMGRLPPDVEKAAKQVVISDMGPVNTGADRDILSVSVEDHAEAQREIDAYLKHYFQMKEILTAKPRQRHIATGGTYCIKTGFYVGRPVLVLGTDEGYYGIPWVDNSGHRACEKFLFRAQYDHIDLLHGRTFVCRLNGEGDDILFHESEIGGRIYGGRTQAQGGG